MKEVEVPLHPPRLIHPMLAENRRGEVRGGVGHSLLLLSKVAEFLTVAKMRCRQVHCRLLPWMVVACARAAVAYANIGFRDRRCGRWSVGGHRLCFVSYGGLSRWGRGRLRLWPLPGCCQHSCIISNSLVADKGTAREELDVLCTKILLNK